MCTKVLKMRRLILWLLFLGGIGLIALGSGFIVTRYAYAQDDEGQPVYVGYDECRSCHGLLAWNFGKTSHALALLEMDEEDDQPYILGDFATGEDVRTVQFPDEYAARPFTLDDVAYVIGSGKYVQRYVYVAEDQSYMVLPVEWNTVEQRWQPFELAESWPDPAYNFGENCAYCHTSGFDTETLEWQEAGVQCESCHGLGSEHIEVADDTGKIREVEDRDQIEPTINLALDAQVCGQCHTRGLSADGIHPYPTGYQPGDELLAEGGYSLVSPDDAAHWWITGHAAQPNMQFNEWIQTAHATSYEDVTQSENFDESCLNCHSVAYRRMEQIIAEEGEEDWFDAAHAAEVNPYGVTCATCHDPHSEEGRDAFLPTDGYSLCADCHKNPTQEDGEALVIHYPVREMFEGIQVIPEVEPITGTHFNLSQGPDCQSCHMPSVSVGTEERVSHALDPILPGDTFTVEGLQDACTDCHIDVTDVEGLQQLIDDTQSSIRTRLTTARQTVRSRHPLWVLQALDFVEQDGSMGIHNYLYADALLDAVEDELGTGATVVSTLPESATTAEMLANLHEKTKSDAVIAGMSPLLLGIAGIGGMFVLAGVGVTFSKRRIFGILSLLIGVVLIGGAVVAREKPVQYDLGGDNDNCLTCHARSRYAFFFPNGSFLDLKINLDRFRDSVHGDRFEEGTFGCYDCHGESAFPHANLPFETLTNYRVEMSRICIDCHTDDVQHYSNILNRNIRIGCSDCHTAHYVQPAESLKPPPVPTFEPTSSGH